MISKVPKVDLWRRELLQIGILAHSILNINSLATVSLWTPAVLLARLRQISAALAALPLAQLQVLFTLQLVWRPSSVNQAFLWKLSPKRAQILMSINFIRPAVSLQHPTIQLQPRARWSSKELIPQASWPQVFRNSTTSLPRLENSIALRYFFIKHIII